MWRVYPVECWYNTHRLIGLWSTQAKVEGNVLRAARHWGTNSSVINNPFGEPGHIPLYVALPSMWGPVDGDLVFPQFVGELHFGDSDRHK